MQTKHVIVLDNSLFFEGIIGQGLKSSRVEYYSYDRFNLSRLHSPINPMRKLFSCLIQLHGLMTIFYSNDETSSNTNLLRGDKIASGFLFVVAAELPFVI